MKYKLNIQILLFCQHLPAIHIIDSDPIICDPFDPLYDVTATVKRALIQRAQPTCNALKK